MRICVIADQIYKSGGIERVLSLRINQWIKKGYDVHLITNENKQRPSYFHYDEQMVHHDLDGNFNKNISLFASSNLVLATQYFFKFKTAIRQIQPDVIVVVNYSYEFYFLPFLRKQSYCVKEYHSSFSAGHGWINRLKNYCTKFYHTHVFLSPEEARLSQQSPYTVIPNPTMQIDVPMRNLAEREKKIIAAGRIVALKGFERLIESWATLAKRYPSWTLEIYGDGEQDYVAQLQQQIEDRVIAQNTKIYPSTNQILDKMLNSRIYVMSSFTECFPMVLLEAMQTKMAIMAYDCPTGPRNILQHQQTGLLVKDGDIAAFSAQLEQLLTDPALAQSLADRAYIDVQQYHIDAVMQKWDKLLHTGENE
ncbi:glycosyltransferase [Acinetobacter variabilis]|uniref:glycosyltransferase n=1 Tax=Acinetobacter variabilis TaxID=70346 RepID=UPI00289F0544|nr:glycosyltransferase [Acinetobacter variabilis]